MSNSNRIGTIALVAVLFVLLGAAVGYAVHAFTALQCPPMPAAGYLAMGLGVLFSLVVGIGLMALLFYSSRHGYDEPYHVDDDQP
jgi:hypothetical protein